MSVDGMKKLIWVTLAIFIAFIVLWIYVSKMQKIEETSQEFTTTSPIKISVVEGTKNYNDIWGILGSQAALTAVTDGNIVTDENGKPVTDESGNPVTEPIDGNGSAPGNPVTDIYGNPVSTTAVPGFSSENITNFSGNTTLASDNYLSETVSVAE